MMIHPVVSRPANFGDHIVIFSGPVTLFSYETNLTGPCSSTESELAVSIHIFAPEAPELESHN